MPDKPAITSDHHERYNQIMNTAVKPAAGKTPPVNPTDKASIVSTLLSTVANPKGIGNKVFVFTGKKKIVLDGKEQEVEKIKTVDMTAKKAETKVISSSAPIPQAPTEEELKIETMAQKETIPEHISEPVKSAGVLSLDKKIETPKIEVPVTTPPPVKPPTSPAPAKKTSTKTTKGRKIGMPMIILLNVALALFIGAWTVFWAVFFGLWTPSFLGK